MPASARRWVPVAPEDMIAAQDETLAVPTAVSSGLLPCRRCGTAWQDAHEGEACARCGSTLWRRKPDSLNRTWALLIAACWKAASTCAKLVSSSDSWVCTSS